jgi:hypothetical protein
MRAIMLLSALFLCAPSMPAQELRQPRRGFSQSSGPAEAPLVRWNVESRRHWRAGLVAGAALGFLLGAAAAGYDGHDASMTRRLGLGVVGAAVLSMPGALIGGLFPKRE